MIFAQLVLVWSRSQRREQGGGSRDYILTSEVREEQERSINLTASWAETETFEFGGKVVRCDKSRKVRDATKPQALF